MKERKRKKKKKKDNIFAKECEAKMAFRIFKQFTIKSSYGKLSS